MEQTNTSEQKFRVSFKQLAKGNFQAEWTVRADTIEELKTLTKQCKDYVLLELDILNGKSEKRNTQ